MRAAGARLGPELHGASVAALLCKVPGDPEAVKHPITKHTASVKLTLTQPEKQASLVEVQEKQQDCSSVLFSFLPFIL